MRTDVREVFSAAASTYGRGNPLLFVEREETARLLPRLEGLTVLDLGCGDGHYARLAAALGAARVLALDAAPPMAALAPPPALVGDAAALPLASASVDVVIAALVLSHVGGLEAALAEAARVLRPGGALVISDLHPIATALGWRRSFEAGGRSVAVEAPPPAAATLRAALAEASLAVEEWREPAVDERLRSEFRRAGRRDFEGLRGTPLLVAVRARKGAVHG